MSEEQNHAKQWLVKARHDLFFLLDSLLGLEPSAETIRDDLSLLAPYAVEVRYPDDDEWMPTEEDAREARAAAGRVLDWFSRIEPHLSGHPD